MSAFRYAICKSIRLPSMINIMNIPNTSGKIFNLFNYILDKIQNLTMLCNRINCYLLVAFQDDIGSTHLDGLFDSFPDSHRLYKKNRVTNLVSKATDVIPSILSQ